MMQKIRNNARAGQEGAAMFLALGFLMVLAILSGAFCTLVHRTMSHDHQRDRHQICLNLAEGGAEKALAELSAHGEAYSGESETPLGDGTFTVAVEPLPGSRTYRIVSTGALHARGFVAAEARVALDAVFNLDGSVQALTWQEVRSW